MNIQEIDNKILELQEKKKKLLEKQEREAQKSKWIKIPNSNYEILCEVTHKNKTLEQIRKDLNKGEEVATYEQVQLCRNLDIHPVFKEFWVFVYPNPDSISTNNNYVAGFGAYSGGAFLDCGRFPSISDTSLGVFIVRKISKKVTA